MRFNYLKKNKYSAEQGVTLIELLVSIAIMSIILVTLGATLVQVISGERRAIALQNVQDNIRSSLEIMGKELRLAHQMSLSDPAPCNSDRNYKVTGSDTIAFKSDQGYCIQYSVVDGQLMKQIDEDLNGVIDLDEPDGPVTSDEITIDALTFTKLFDDAAESPNRQPSVTINMVVSSKRKAFQDVTTLSLQTTVTQRNLNVNP